MAEIELSAIVRKYLSRRIASQDVLGREVVVLTRERNEKRVTIQWQFSVGRTRRTRNPHHPAAHPDNAVCEKLS